MSDGLVEKKCPGLCFRLFSFAMPDLSLLPSSLNHVFAAV